MTSRAWRLATIQAAGKLYPGAPADTVMAAWHALNVWENVKDDPNPMVVPARGGVTDSSWVEMDQKLPDGVSQMDIQVDINDTFDSFKSGGGPGKPLVDKTIATVMFPHSHCLEAGRSNPARYPHRDVGAVLRSARARSEIFLARASTYECGVGQLRAYLLVHDWGHVWGHQDHPARGGHAAGILVCERTVKGRHEVQVPSQ